METQPPQGSPPVHPEVPPSGGSLEIGNSYETACAAPDWSSPFGGIPRNWKRRYLGAGVGETRLDVPPSGGSLEIGNTGGSARRTETRTQVPPSGGSLEIGNLSDLGSMIVFPTSSPFGGIPRNWKLNWHSTIVEFSKVPPSGGSLEIGNAS